MTTYVDKVETDEFGIDLITLKDGRVLGISYDCVVLYADMQDYLDKVTMSRQCIDLYAEDADAHDDDDTPIDDTPHPSGVTAEWDGEDWTFRGDLIKKHWDWDSTCFSPMELGYSYEKACRLPPNQAIDALMVWLDETLQHPQGEKV